MRRNPYRSPSARGRVPHTDMGSKGGNRIGLMAISVGNAPFMDQPSKSPLAATRTTARAFFIGDRLNTSGLERGDVLATMPLAFRVNENGVAVLFRYGVVVLIGLNALEEDEFLRGLDHRIPGKFARRDEEIAIIELAPEKEDQVPPGGPICLQSLSPERLVLISEALAKSVVLARHEREVASVFDATEPVARELARSGRMHGSRRSILKNIGNALVVRLIGEGDSLIVQPEGQGKLPLRYIGDETFAADFDPTLRLRFTVSAGRVVSTSVEQRGEVVPLRRRP